MGKRRRGDRPRHDAVSSCGRRSAIAVGARPCHSVLLWMCRTRSSNARSEPARPTICIATGRPSSPKPAGSATAESEQINEAGEAAHRAKCPGRRAAGFRSHSAAVGVAMAMTGSKATSAPARTRSSKTAIKRGRASMLAASVSSATSSPLARRRRSTGATAGSSMRARCTRALSANMIVRAWASMASIAGRRPVPRLSSPNPTTRPPGPCRLSRCPAHNTPRRHGARRCSGRVAMAADRPVSQRIFSAADRPRFVLSMEMVSSEGASGIEPRVEIRP